MSRVLNCCFGVFLYSIHSREHSINCILLLRGCVGAVVGAEPHSPAGGAPPNTPVQFQSEGFSLVTLVAHSLWSCRCQGGTRATPASWSPSPAVLSPSSSPHHAALHRGQSHLFIHSTRGSPALSPHQAAPFTAGEGVTWLRGLRAIGQAWEEPTRSSRKPQHHRGSSS